MKVTITLSDKAAKYLAEVMYSLHNEKSEDGTVTKEEAINHSLESLADFETLEDQDLVGWIANNHPYFYVGELDMDGEPNDLN